jgi:hypothetical protein
VVARENRDAGVAFLLIERASTQVDKNLQLFRLANDFYSSLLMQVETLNDFYLSITVMVIYSFLLIVGEEIDFSLEVKVIVIDDFEGVVRGTSLFGVKVSEIYLCLDL